MSARAASSRGVFSTVGKVTQNGIYGKALPRLQWEQTTVKGRRKEILPRAQHSLEQLTTGENMRG